jgi:putative protease
MAKVKEKQIGEITHYFGKIGVAVIKLKDDLKVGESIKIVGGERELIQEVSSMQVEHENIDKAKKGESVGLKVDETVRPGDKVYQFAE